jgi:hypothetical protein
MNFFVSCMQILHLALAFPALLWVRVNVWAGRQWEKLRRRGQ